MISWFLVLVICHAATDEPICVSRLFPLAMASYYECAAAYVVLRPIYEPKGFRCTNTRPIGMPELQQVEPGRWA